jgi:hypothetical protein
MTIHYKHSLVKDINPLTFVGDKGIDIVWKNTDDGLAATLIAEDKSMINNQLSKLKLIQDSIKTWHTFRDLPHYPHKTILHEDGKIEKG